jgi:flagellar export protein FliJ
MNELRRKQKRVEPLIRIRQEQLDQETEELNRIRKAKSMTMERLRTQQSKYNQGVADINHLRQSGDLAKLPSLERGLDHVKNVWYETVKELRILEQKERAQIEQLYLAQRNVKSMESLSDKYAGQLKEYINKQEQKAMDEYAINRFVSKKQE